MEKTILDQFGYRTQSNLEDIVRKEHSHLLDWTSGNYASLTPTNLHQQIKEFEDLLQEKDVRGPLLRLGYAYTEKGQNPSMEQIWKALLKGSGKTYYEEIEQRAADPNLSKREKQLIVDQISATFVDIAKGSFIYKTMPQLYYYKDILSKYDEYFTQFGVPEKMLVLVADIEFLEMFVQTGFDFRQTLHEYVTQHGLINSLRDKFESIISPDKSRTIKDQIQKITALTEVSDKETIMSSFAGKLNLYNTGFMMAIRGEDQTLVALLKQQHYYVFGKFDHYWQKEEGFGSNPVENAKETVRRLALGYAYSYHLRFLEDRAGKLNPSPSNTDSQISDNHAIKLIWKGQKNQLYDVIRQLKGRGLVGNSYEELATFLRDRVNIFRDTALSTITKELGKEKRPPKDRRVNLNLD